MLLYKHPNTYAHLADDAAMIQAAVDAASAHGVRVVIPRRNARTGQDIWVLPRAVLLPSDITVHLDNCHLRQADNSFDNLFKNATARTDAALRVENRQHDIHILGIGNAVLDGGNHNDMTERNARGSREQQHDLTMYANSLIHFHNAERVRVENLRLVNARYWAVTFHYCSFGRVRDLHFMTAARCPNQDGVDLRLGCSDFVIENITGYTQDDSVALTALNDPGMEVAGLCPDIHGVVIRNVHTAARCANVRLLNHYGHRLYNIVVENVQSSVEVDPASPKADDYALRLPDAEPVAWAHEQPWWPTFEGRERRASVCVRIGENGYFGDGGTDSRARLGDTFNIIVRNVQAASLMGVSISRTLCDSVFDGIHMFGESAAAVYIGEGEYDNLRFTNVGFARNAAVRAEDTSPRGGNYGYEAPAAVLFNKAHATRLTFDGVTAHPAGHPAFAGSADVQATARNVVLRGDAQAVAGGLQIDVVDGMVARAPDA